MTILKLRKRVDLDDQVIKGYAQEEDKLKNEACETNKRHAKVLEKARKECVDKDVEIGCLLKDHRVTRTNEMNQMNQVDQVEKELEELRKEL